MIKLRLYDASGRWVELDTRHVIARVAMGDPSKPWAFHWCGEEFISNHTTKAEATKAALQWEMDRVTRMAGKSYATSDFDGSQSRRDDNRSCSIQGRRSVSGYASLR